MLRIGSLVFALAVSGLTPAMANPAAAPSVEQDANARTRAFIVEKMAAKRIPGMQIAVVRDGRIVLSEAYGVANIEHQVPVTHDTVFPINSATKSFTGVAAMQLVEAGKLDLEAPVSRYIDNLPAAWRPIRIRQLLAHTSGLPDIVGGKGMIGGGGEAEAWAAVKALPMDGKPGAGFRLQPDQLRPAGRDHQQTERQAVRG